ncbi:protein prenylyltransferase [Lentinus tigrinus ALCF2SS1-7]|uniref:Protein prenylyltransferase n=1 Tax=Lentinus tigrinus ALCF2SS1-6 TaxID=1328759 RepID=A0A5C2RN55_9APHY|nr:protein prenylyltransferase [Lentinus tigrinus ALCF2SS1-6]RPD68080.1 protein prenylyltransferase [Lentinus tigrinus ALCF2SS1-7]
MSALSGSELSSRLAELLNVPPISIELLPGDGSEWLAVASPDHAPFLFTDRNLGVPQKAAYKAYLEAVSRFRSVRPRLLHPGSPRGQPVSDRDIAEAAASSSVLLLVNPAHQSALNTRKRLVELGSLDAAHELAFTGALLTLREGAKQSILWQHRRWLLRRIHPPIRPPQAPSPSQGDGVDSLYGVALDAGTFRAEFATVEQACEVYPRNYHAWAHRFLCAQALIFLLQACDDSGDTPPGVLLEVLKEENARARFWMERHVSDYSAMQYYFQLESFLPQDSPLRLRMLSTSAEDSVQRHAMELVRAYPTHESLWLYLRSSVSSAPRTDARGTPMSANHGEVSALTEQFLSSSADRDRIARRHAVWFVAWMAWKDKTIHADSSIIRRIVSMAEESSPLMAAELVACLSTEAR